MTNNISLYFHIPFCVKKCNYCAFYSLPSASDHLKNAYFEALKRQINLFETEKEVKTVYFGGGTPPVLGVDRICELLRILSSRVHLSEDCEITIEINPKTVELESLCELKGAGFNRISVGVQSADDNVLRSLGRIHSSDDAKNCIAEARRAGFENISADIIFALPFEARKSFKQIILDIIATGVDHISAYSLQIEEGTPIYKNREQLDFPDEDSEEKQYNELCEVLKAHGFCHYEISSFAKCGYESRHNLNYWAGGEYFGFGAGAHSFYNGKRFSALCDVEEFIKKSELSLLAPTDFEVSSPLTEQEMNDEKIMLGLRTKYGARIPEDRFKIAEMIANQGFGEFDCGVLRLNSKGFRVSNAIIGMILT